MSDRFARLAWARLGGRWYADPVVKLTSAGPQLVAARSPDQTALAQQEITLLPPITDAHVHLGLTDQADAGPCRLARVLDLGWSSAITALAIDAAATHPALDVRYAGAFLTAPAGYPTDRSWAPPGSTIELADTAAATLAVRHQAARDASVIKVALNAEAGPVPDDAVLASIVREARSLRLPVVAHAEGVGQVERALAAGVDVLAHAPWTEHLPDEVVRRCAERMVWITTLAMHARAGDIAAFGRAMDNLTRFVAWGGHATYGTDLGNGSSRLDLDFAEITALQQAGITGSALVDALVAAPFLGGAATASVFAAEIHDDAAVLESLHRSRPMRLADLAMPA